MQKKVWVDDEQYEQLKAISDKDGIPIAEQVRRAIREWLDKRQDKNGGQNVQGLSS